MGGLRGVSKYGAQHSTRRVTGFHDDMGTPAQNHQARENDEQSFMAKYFLLKWGFWSSRAVGCQDIYGTGGD